MARHSFECTFCCSLSYNKTLDYPEKMYLLKSNLTSFIIHIIHMVKESQLFD